MRLVRQAGALAGRGLEGDRYADGTGTSSSRAARRPGFDLTLIAAEVVEDLTARDARLDVASTRRNVLTRGIDVNALVGRDFTIGGVRCRGQRLAERCAHLEGLSGPGLLRPLIHRGGPAPTSSPTATSRRAATSAASARGRPCGTPRAALRLRPPVTSRTRRQPAQSSAEGR